MEQLWKRIVGLDLKVVSNRFSATKNWWWHLLHKPIQIESQYRQFLSLLASNPEGTILPWSQDLTGYWYQHTLDRRKYEADCKAIVDRLLPYAPLVDGKSAKARAEAETQKLYLAVFGESARQRRKAVGETWGEFDSVQFDSDQSGPSVHHHHAKHSWWHSSTGHPGSGHHAGSHDAGQHSSGSHDGGGHHGCGGHSSCGGHSGCGHGH